MSFGDNTARVIGSMTHGIEACARSIVSFFDPETFVAIPADAYLSISGDVPIRYVYPRLYGWIHKPHEMMEMELRAAETSWMNPAYWADAPFNAFDQFVTQAGTAIPQAAAFAYSVGTSRVMNMTSADIATAAARTAGTSADWLGETLFGSPTIGGITPDGAMIAIPVAQEGTVAIAGALGGDERLLAGLTVFNMATAGAAAEPRVLQFRTREMEWYDQVFEAHKDDVDFSQAYELYCRFRRFDPETVVARRGFADRLLRLGVAFDEDGTANRLEAFSGGPERTLTLRQLIEVDIRCWAHQDDARFVEAFDGFSRTILGGREDVAAEERFLLQLEKAGVRFGPNGLLIRESLEPALVHVEETLTINREHLVSPDRLDRIRLYHALRTALDSLLGMEPRIQK